MADSSATTGGAPPRLHELFVGFATIALQGFGGVLPFARREIVERRGWLTPVEFNDTLGLAQFLPGGNVVNMSVAVGARHRGIPGAVAAFLGLLAPPFCIVLAMVVAYGKVGHHPVVQGALGGVAAGSVGLVAGTGVRMARALGRDVLTYGVLAAVFVAVALLRLPLVMVMLTAAPVSIALVIAFRR